MIPMATSCYYINYICINDIHYSCWSRVVLFVIQQHVSNALIFKQLIAEYVRKFRLLSTKLNWLLTEPIGKGKLSLFLCNHDGKFKWSYVRYQHNHRIILATLLEYQQRTVHKSLSMTIISWNYYGWYALYLLQFVANMTSDWSSCCIETIYGGNCTLHLVWLTEKLSSYVTRYIRMFLYAILYICLILLQWKSKNYLLSLRKIKKSNFSWHKNEIEIWS